MHSTKVSSSLKINGMNKKAREAHMLNKKMEQVRLIKASCATESKHLPFREIFNAAFISSVFEMANLEYRDRVFSPSGYVNGIHGAGFKS